MAAACSTLQHLPPLPWVSLGWGTLTFPYPLALTHPHLGELDDTAQRSRTCPCDGDSPDTAAGTAPAVTWEGGAATVVSGASLAATAVKAVTAVVAVAAVPMVGGVATAAVRLRARLPPDRRHRPTNSQQWREEADPNRPRERRVACERHRGTVHPYTRA